ncbi:MAG: hypothetical protein C0507_15705 [Cyanobacteria bacterium PR.3.49]|nr:hypothetical protein [Cyanobacteria bacterium PR.3.49]
MAVSWGKLQRYKFASGGELKMSIAPPGPAVFAVTYKQNPTSKPKAHTVLYFGHAENLNQDLPGVSEQLHDLWTKHAGNREDLYVFFYPMPGSSPHDRRKVHDQLVSEYSPSGNY